MSTTTKVKDFTYDGPKMDLLEKSRWIAALLDGSFKQGRGALCKIPTGRHGGKREPRYCCLGVKAVVDGHTFRPDGRPWRPDNFLCLMMADGSTGTYTNGLPSGIVRDASGDKIGDLPDFFADVNDKRRWSFQRIARWIDQNL